VELEERNREARLDLYLYGPEREAVASEVSRYLTAPWDVESRVARA
jgi:hypothetical protein